MYTVEPGTTFPFRKPSSVELLKSGMTAIRARPVMRSRFSTATKTSAAFLPFSCRLPLNPAWDPPTQVSSTSTSPRSGSRFRLIIARRNLCSIIHAVSYRRSASWRCRSSAETPRLSVVIRYAAQNQTVSGVLVLCRIVCAVSETWCRQPVHCQRRSSTNS